MSAPLSTSGASGGTQAGGAGGRRVVVVTGASSGIGRAIARELVRRGGYALVLAARREVELRALARELDPSGVWVLAVPSDVTDAVSRQALLNTARTHFGRVDVLINNAGVTIQRGWWWDDPDPLRVVRVNLESPIELTRLVLPEFQARASGQIVNIGSVAGRVATNGMYSASKFGLRGFSQGLRRELLGTGIQVSLIAPGFVKSEMTASARLPMPGPEVVARAVADVLVRPRAEVVVPRTYWAAVLLGALWPALADRLVRRIINRRSVHEDRKRSSGGRSSRFR